MKGLILLLLCAVYVHGDEIKEDNDTQLIWQNNSAVQESKKDWYDAKRYCESLVLSSYNNWRLPTIKELQTLVNTQKSKPAIKEDFAFTASSYYWSSTERLNDPYNAWLVHFDYGYTDYSSTSGKNYVRCVR